MRSTHSRDRNLFFNYDRSELIGPQKKGGYINFEIAATNQDWSRIPRPSGRDQNIFFRVRKTLQPTLRTRVFKDLEPLSRFIGSLPTTKKERQANAVVAAIEGILNSLKAFISTPEVDDQGNPVLDPITNKPVMRVRTITEVLEVAHGALNQVYTQNNVVLSPVFQQIVRSFTVASSVNVIESVKNIMKVNPNMPQNEKNLTFKNEILAERVDTDDEVKAHTPLSEAIPQAILEQKTNDGEWRGVFVDKWIRPNQWRVIIANKRLKLALIDIITNREDSTNAKLRTVLGTRLSYPETGSLLQQMGMEFGVRGGGALLNLETLRFIIPRRVPPAERAEPVPSFILPP